MGHFELPRALTVQGQVAQVNSSGHIFLLDSLCFGRLVTERIRKSEADQHKGFPRLTHIIHIDVCIIDGRDPRPLCNPQMPLKQPLVLLPSESGRPDNSGPACICAASAAGPAPSDAWCTVSPQASADIPPDIWPRLARAALAAKGDSVAAWQRLSMVSRIWRMSVAGVRCFVCLLQGTDISCHLH